MEQKEIHDDQASHKFYVFKTQNSFEQITGDDLPALPFNEPVYRLVEYAIMFCNCGHSIKIKIEQPHEQKAS